MIRVVMALVSTAVGLVLLLSFKSHSGGGAAKSALAGAGSGAGSGSGGGGAAVAGPQPGDGATTGASPGPSAAGKGSASAPHKAGKNGTFTGDPISTQWGIMQVAAVVRNGKLTGITVLQETDGGRSHEIDNAAIPILKSQAITRQSANIDVVSGATITSQGYAQSLQSALDKAGI